MVQRINPPDAVDEANTYHAWKMHDELLERENRRKATCADCARAHDPADDGFQNPQGICWCDAYGEFMLLSNSASIYDCEEFEWR